jgi:hypothetical protein
VNKNFVLWVDPGMTSGWASYDLFTRSFLSGQERFEPFGQFLTDTVDFIGRELTVGWEDYLIAGRRSGTPKYALEVIGMIKWIARDCELLKPQPSASRIGVSRTVLLRIGWWNPGHKHANDAAMHLLGYLVDQKLLTIAMQEAFTADLEMV